MSYPTNRRNTDMAPAALFVDAPVRNESAWRKATREALRAHREVWQCGSRARLVPWGVKFVGAQS